MNKIASPQDVCSEIHDILAYCDGTRPSRQTAASMLNRLARRVASIGGPFEGQGWDEQKKWLQEAKRSAPQKVTPQRAKQIMQQARAHAKHGPWVESLERVMTQGEYRFISDYWETMPGNTSFLDALMTLAQS